MKINLKQFDTAIASNETEIKKLQEKISAKQKDFEAQEAKRKKEFTEKTIEPIKAKISELQKDIADLKRCKAMMDKTAKPQAQAKPEPEHVNNVPENNQE